MQLLCIWKSVIKCSFVLCMCITYSTPGGYFDNDTEHFCTVEINANPVTESAFIIKN